MTGDCHVRFCEKLVGQFHRLTLHVDEGTNRMLKQISINCVGQQCHRINFIPAHAMYLI